ncbi:putative Alpha-glucosides-binding periplasmic protein AglE [Streptomyces aurantiacus JA 4570]|uniref:Putative Alpha-glucosides-binding periplasmic protein AglE n=1 Tax=Streptomyces aurantiacus JA 4570 TaxID=1286094 RepID=S3ZID1_9ACTN|nr:extracellular solute-binding protein [Streptomyces aurantiacus]EPH42913.1 putative Alpha-glucosides-binding periplasmic protein AglE [Streptomyces aurantiacus JA 4570]
MTRPHRRPALARRPARTALACCLLLLAALMSGGCADRDRETLVVLGPWTGAEGVAFEAMLKRLDDGTGETYTYKGTRSLRETLVAQLEAGDPPDVAVLNSLGELTEYARGNRLEPLDSPGHPPWAPRVDVNGSRRTYWVPLKVDLKSLVWSKSKSKGKAGGSGGARPRWCVGMASQATSGWPGTDWIEDLVLHRSGPGTYARWATGRLSWRSPEVRGAWTAWAELLGERSKKSVDLSLTTSYEGTPDPKAARPAPRGLLNSPELDCTHEHQSAFIRYLYANANGSGGAKGGSDGGVRVDPSARFLPGPAAHDGAYEVAGDMAAVFSGNPAARELVERLSGSAARRLWHEEAEPELRPFFPGAGDPQPTDPGGGEAAALLTGKADTLCFDASDAMPPALRDAFHRAVLRYFRDPSGDRLDTLLGQLDTVRAETGGTTGDSPGGASGGGLPPDAVCAPPSDG